MINLREKLIGMTVAAQSQRGASAVEYGLILGLIAVLIVATLQLMGPELNSLFVKIKDALVTANT